MRARAVVGLVVTHARVVATHAAVVSSQATVGTTQAVLGRTAGIASSGAGRREVAAQLVRKEAELLVEWLAGSPDVD